MAKSFIALNKGLTLLDFFTFGKYKNCRVDSILIQDPEYIVYTRKQFGTLYDAGVLEKIEGAMATIAKNKEYEQRKKIKVYHGTWDYITKEYEMEDFNWMDDVPF